MSAEYERAEIPGPLESALLPSEGTATDRPLTPAMRACLLAHGEASWHAARLIGAALLTGGFLLGLFNLLIVMGSPAVRVFLFLIGFIPLAAIAGAVLLVGRRYRRDAARDVAAGSYVTEVGPVHIARTLTAAGILTRGHVHALFQPYPGIVTIVNGDVPAGVYPNATVAYSRYGHYVFTLADVSGRTLYRAPGLPPARHA